MRALCIALLVSVVLSGLPAVYADEPAVNARYVLLDTRGRMIGNEDFPGRFQLLTFGYTSCPDVCPTQLTTMTQVLHALGSDAERLQLIFITVDPARDTREVLARYIAYFDPRIIALSGSPQQLQATAQHFNVRFRDYHEPGSPAQVYSVDHTSGMYLIGPDGNFIRKFSQAAPAAEITAQVRELLAQDAGR